MGPIFKRYVYLLSSAVSCRELQWAAVTCSELQSPAVSCSHLQWAAVTCSEQQSLAVSCSVLQWAAVTCSELQWAAMSCSHLLSLATSCITSNHLQLHVTTLQSLAILQYSKLLSLFCRVYSSNKNSDSPGSIAITFSITLILCLKKNEIISLDWLHLS